MATDANNQQLFAAVQTYSGAPGQAIEQLRPLAEGGDDRAIALIAYFYLQQGQIDEALPFITQAVQLGYGQIAQLCANDFAQRERVELRSRTPEFVNAALDNGWSVDVFQPGRYLCPARAARHCCRASLQRKSASSSASGRAMGGAFGEGRARA